MCDLSKMLLAWIDGELTAQDAARVECHLQICDECRSRAQEYRRVSCTFEAYCDIYSETLTVSKSRREFAGWLPGISAATAVTAIVTLLVLFPPRARVPQLPVPAPMPAHNTAMNSLPVQTAQAATNPEQPIGARLRTAPRQRHGSRPVPKQESLAAHSAQQTPPRQVNALPGAPAVEIAIPADALFPPGAVPPGVVFTADVTIVPDASAQQISFRPQLAQFERRLTRP
jgi:anti-sigma factor RsiW